MFVFLRNFASLFGLRLYYRGLCCFVRLCGLGQKKSHSLKASRSECTIYVYIYIFLYGMQMCKSFYQNSCYLLKKKKTRESEIVLCCGKRYLSFCKFRSLIGTFNVSLRKGKLVFKGVKL